MVRAYPASGAHGCANPPASAVRVVATAPRLYAGNASSRARSLVVRRVAERVRVGQVGEPGVPAVVRGEEHGALAVARLLHLLGERAAHHGARRAVAGAEAGGVDPVDAGEEARRPRGRAGRCR
jgi:hypothetical protein